MPQIKTFENDVRAPQATSAGSSAFEIEGRHVEAAYAQAGNAIGRGLKEVGGEVEQYQQMQDTSQNSAQGAAAFADLSTKLSQASAAAAADPANAQKHFQDFQNAMEDTIGSIGQDADTKLGRRNAESIQNTLREEFTRQSMGAQSIVQGQQIKTNLEQSKNSIAQAVANNPTLLETGIALLHGTVEDQLEAHSGTLKPEENARIREEFTNPAIKDLGLTAFKSMAENNPQAAKAQLASGRFSGMFSGAEIQTLNAYADQQARAQTTAQKAAVEAKNKADEQDFKAQASAIVGSYIQPDGSMQIPPGAPQAIIKLSLHPGAALVGPGEIKSLADMTNTILKDQAKKLHAVSDPQTYQSFGAKLTQGNLTAQEIYDARTNGMLSDKDTGYFIRAMHNLAQDPAKKDAEKQFNAWANSQKSAFTKSNNLLGIADPHGMEKFNQFYQDAHARFEQVYDAKGNWQGLLSAKDSSYLGKIAPQYMQNVKGASALPPPRFTTDAEADKGVALLKSGQAFIGPDGKQHYKK